jgi:hypothetical protein
MAHRPRPPMRMLLAALVALVVAGLAACSGGGTDTASDSGGGSDSARPASAEDALGGRGPKGLGGGDGARSAGRVGPMTRQVIMTGKATLQADDVTGLRDEVGRLVDRIGGYVSSERTFNDEEGRLVEDRLVLRVPSSRFTQLLADFDGLAVVLDSVTESDDVTTEVIDVDARVRTAEVSLDRLRSFLRRSNDVNALIRLESEMAEREADLASLRAQQDYLEDQTRLATLDVTLQRPPEDEPGDDGDDGFLAGLSGGWDALTGVLVVAATLLGAVIPFGLVAALLGVPALLVLRASRRRRPGAEPATASQGMSGD